MLETPSSWVLPAHCVGLEPDEVHVWRVELDMPCADLAHQIGSLASDERAKADRFHFAHDRARYIAAHVAMRAILGRYLRVAPAALVFSATHSGKPFIQSPPQSGSTALTFNLSHAHDLALIAVSMGHAVGIDVERICPELAEQHIAEHFLAPEEVTALRALPLEVQAVAFFNCWTRKEAFVKARGEGLSLPLDRFTVTLAPGQPAALLSAADDSVQASRWQLWSLEPGPSYAAALAVDCPRCRVITFRYSAAG